MTRRTGWEPIGPSTPCWMERSVALASTPPLLVTPVFFNKVLRLVWFGLVFGGNETSAASPVHTQSCGPRARLPWSSTSIQKIEGWANSSHWLGSVWCLERLLHSYWNVTFTGRHWHAEWKRLAESNRSLGPTLLFLRTLTYLIF